MWHLLDTIPGFDLAIFGCAYLMLWRLGAPVRRDSSRYGRFRAVLIRQVREPVGSWGKWITQPRLFRTARGDARFGGPI